MYGKFTVRKLRETNILKFENLILDLQKKPDLLDIKLLHVR